MAERLSHSGSLCAEAGQGLPPFPAPLCPPAASFLRCAPDKFSLTKPNTFPHNREASVATLRWCSGSSRNTVRLPFGMSVQLHRNPHLPSGYRALNARAQFEAPASKLQRTIDKRQSNAGMHFRDFSNEELTVWHYFSKPVPFNRTSIPPATPKINPAGNRVYQDKKSRGLAPPALLGMRSRPNQRA